MMNENFKRLYIVVGKFVSWKTQLYKKTQLLKLVSIYEETHLLENNNFKNHNLSYRKTYIFDQIVLEHSTILYI